MRITTALILCLLTALITYALTRPTSTPEINCAPLCGSSPLPGCTDEEGDPLPNGPRQ